MKQRIIALVCLLAILVGTFAVGATANAKQGDSYMVGYSKKDVNPWIQSAYTGPDLGIPAADVKDADGNFIDGIVPVSLSDNNTGEQQYIVSVPLSGYGNITTDRNADKMTDDNGDGILGLGDGVFTTATAVSDDWGTTVIFVTIDNINGVPQLTEKVRTLVVKALGGVINTDQIMISANHSHEAPTLNTCYSSWNTNMNPDNANRTGKVTALGVYWLYYVDRVVAACKEAYENRSEATMSKGAVDATAVTGYQMNFVRHYKATVEKQEAKVTFWTQGSWSTKSTVDAYVGDNFGATGVTSETKYSGFSGTSKRTVSTITDHATQSDDTMYLLKFDRAESAGNDIVLVNWKAHASNNGHSYFKNLSSDYINALRYRLENNTDFGGDQNYCVGFWMGASGNYNNSSRIASEYTYNPYGTQAGWPTIVLNDKGEGNDVKVPLETNATGFFADYYAGILNSAGTGNGYADEFYRSALYGYILGKIALAGLESEMVNTDHGAIRNIQNNYAAATRSYTDAEIAAADEWQAKYKSGEITEAKKNSMYTASNGTVINSYYHAYSILNRSSAKTVTLELNVIVLGSNVALVTGTGELFDNYDINGSTDPLDNDWLELINCVEGSDFGTPFVLSYSNNSTGYAPNVLAYDFYTDATATVAVGTAMGSYEANTTTLARGTGEAVIQEYKKMLTSAYSDYLEYECPECGAVALWRPLGAEQANYTPGQGHYYLTTDLNGTGMAGQKSLGYSDGSLAIDVCIDLNGYTFSSESRCFIIYNKCKLSIFDMRDNVPGKNSGSTGMMVGHSFSNNPGGGAFSVNGGATVNLYGGTLKFVKVDNPSWYGTGTGGTFSLAGTLNVYGGRIEGGDMVKSTYGDSYYGLGGAVYLNSGGTLNMTGGTITSGSVPEGGLGPCVYMVNKTTSRINLSGDASIEDVYYRYNSGSALKITGTYTGSLGLTFHPDIALKDNLDIGNAATGADISRATITLTDTTEDWSVGISRTNLVLKRNASTPKAVIVVKDEVMEYSSLADAVKAYSVGYIKLMGNDNSAVTLTRDAYLDLNGHNAEGAITAESATLYCFDSQTDDYTVADGVYGKLTNATGNIKGLPVESNIADDGYMKITETSGVSFHRVNLKISHMTLRQRNSDDEEGVYNPGIYYKAKDGFAADEVVAAKITKYGVAMSVTNVPDANNMETECGYSWFTKFEPGKDSNSASGTLLREVLKETNSDEINRENAESKIYGSAYVLTEDGYMFGECLIRTFREQVEIVDSMWSELTPVQKERTLEMYKSYSSVMESWDIPDILAALNAQ